MFEPTKLQGKAAEWCYNTISTSTFYMLVADALLSNEALSTVRMGDGEKLLMDYCEGYPSNPQDRNVHDEDWMRRLGVFGIDKELLKLRLENAANECTWFGPSISGIIRPEFELYHRFRARERYVDNFWCNAWTDEMKINLYKAAGKVLFIHRNPLSFEALKIRAAKIGVEASYIQMDNWSQAHDVIAQANENDAPLVIFSAGPAAKFIGHRIATGDYSRPKVTLDLGNSSDQWLLYCLHDK